MPVSKTVPLHLIDEPELAMRVEIPDSYIAELARDIELRGLINPLTVTKEGQRYRLHAGHCRMLACKRLGKADVDVRDYTGEDAQLEGLKFAENRHRLDVSDGEMAIYLAEVQDKYHYTAEKLMEITGESEDWISKRLRLFAGDSAVFAALLKKQINLGQAIELNRFPPEFIAHYLDVTINSTPPVRLLQEWRRQVPQMQAGTQQQAASDGSTAAPAVPVTPVLDSCGICGSDQLPYTMDYVKVHKHCWQMVIKAINQEQKG